MMHCDMPANPEWFRGALSLDGLARNEGEMSKIDDDRIIIEFISVGAYVKVSAVDPVTGTEVSIVGNPMSGEETLKRTAVRKLHYVMEKQQGKR